MRLTGSGKTIISANQFKLPADNREQDFAIASLYDRFPFFSSWVLGDGSGESPAYNLLPMTDDLSR
jgi:hypothetical protein